jgi:hypothetical protein
MSTVATRRGSSRPQSRDLDHACSSTSSSSTTRRPCTRAVSSRLSELAPASQVAVLVTDELDADVARHLATDLGLERSPKLRYDAMTRMDLLATLDLPLMADVTRDLLAVLSIMKPFP